MKNIATKHKACTERDISWTGHMPTPPSYEKNNLTHQSQLLLVASTYLGHETIETCVIQVLAHAYYFSQAIVTCIFRTWAYAFLPLLTRVMIKVLSLQQLHQRFPWLEALEPYTKTKVCTTIHKLHPLATHFLLHIIDPAQLHWASHFDSPVKLRLNY